jgi:hypothetical protein
MLIYVQDIFGMNDNDLAIGSVGVTQPFLPSLSAGMRQGGKVRP